MADLDTARFARHLLLPEIGKAGQERLLAARVHVPAGVDAGAVEVAREYLTRAGVTVDEADARPSPTPLPQGGGGPESGSVRSLDLCSSQGIEALAGRPELIEAARALAGALSAVESIKAVLSLGEPQSSAPAVLSSEGP